jgi:hypothetical protein
MQEERGTNNLENTMTLKKGQIFSISLKDSKDTVTGLIVDLSKDWLLIKYIPVDYVVDGYMIVSKGVIKKHWRKDEEKFKELVLKAKGVTAKSNFLISKASQISPLKKLQQKKMLLQLNLGKEDICYVGKIIEIKDDSFVLEKMGTKANWLDLAFYDLESIWTIQFNNDYLKSLIAYNKSKQKG